MKIYKVGGYVRDTLLGLTPKDIDYVVVGATPEQMLELGFSQVGADFPVFLHPTTNDEYALARVERKTGNGYHGFSVDASPDVTLEDDLRRRDLTINSMAMDDEGNIYDYFGGQEDLKNKILRHTSDAFSEDPLRVIRLARFYARYSEFTVNQTTLLMCKKLVWETQCSLNEIKDERFWLELEKAFQEKQVDRFFDLIFWIGADTRVNFFSTLLNQTTWNTQRILQSAKNNSLLTCVVLMSGKDGQTVKIAPKNIQLAAQHWNAFLKTDFTRSDQILKLLTATGNFRQGDTFQNIVDVMMHASRAQLLTDEQEDNLKKFSFAAKMTNSINAKMFEGVEGKQLGEAINAARIAAIELLM